MWGVTVEGCCAGGINEGFRRRSQRRSIGLSLEDLDIFFEGRIVKSILRKIDPGSLRSQKLTHLSRVSVYKVVNILHLFLTSLIEFRFRDITL